MPALCAKREQTLSSCRTLLTCPCPCLRFRFMPAHRWITARRPKCAAFTMKVSIPRCWHESFRSTRYAESMLPAPECGLKHLCTGRCASVSAAGAMLHNIVSDVAPTGANARSSVACLLIWKTLPAANCCTGNTCFPNESRRKLDLRYSAPPEMA